MRLIRTNLFKTTFYKQYVNVLSYSTLNNDDFVVKSPVKDIQIPNLLLHQFLDQNINKHHDRILVECIETHKKLTYGETRQMSRNLATFLWKLNLMQNDKVAVFLPNVPEYFVAILGVLRAGLVLSTINPIYTPGEISRQLINSKSKIIITTNKLYANAKAAITEAKLNIPILVIKQSQDEVRHEGAIDFNEICSKSHGKLIDSKQTQEDVAFLPYSSGTTGLPKGVELTHKNLIANCLQITDENFALLKDQDEQDVVPIIIPLYHAYGLNAVAVFQFNIGVKFTLSPHFNTEMYYKFLHDYPPSVLYLVPPLVLMLINNEKLNIDKVKSLRSIVSAAAPLGISDIERLMQRTKAKVDFLQIYGMTELSPVSHKQSMVLRNGNKVGGCGLAVANTEFKICEPGDRTFKGLGPKKNGVLLVKGPQVMRGYFENEEANKETLVNDGWLVTGDIGYYDDDGHLFITDRLKELIKVRGYQVAPAELEEILRSHPDIEDAAVIGVKDERDGEIPKAFIVMRNGAALKEKHIHEYMEKNVVKYKQLKGGIVFLDQIPKTSSGKILRRVLKDQ